MADKLALAQFPRVVWADRVALSSAIGVYVRALFDFTHVTLGNASSDETKLCDANNEILWIITITLEWNTPRAIERM